METNLILLLITLLIGVAVLFLGRQLFWLFVGAVGFLIGFNLAAQFLSGQPDWVQLLIGLAAGLLGALLAIPLQRLAIGVAGFLAGGYAVFSLLQTWGVERGVWLIVGFIVGGIIAAVLVELLFDWALIGLSSVVGATILVNAFTLNRPMTTLAFVGLLLLGIIVQGLQIERPVTRTIRVRRRPPDEV